ncbi:unnamed protein product [Closterium sp. NIES-54]
MARCLPPLHSFNCLPTSVRFSPHRFSPIASCSSGNHPGPWGEETSSGRCKGSRNEHIADGEMQYGAAHWKNVRRSAGTLQYVTRNAQTIFHRNASEWLIRPAAFVEEPPPPPTRRRLRLRVRVRLLLRLLLRLRLPLRLQPPPPPSASATATISATAAATGCVSRVKMKEAGASSNSSSGGSGSGGEWERAQQAVRVSVDLVAAAQQQFRLLRAVDCCVGLYSGPAVRRAIRRRVTVLGILRGGEREGGMGGELWGGRVRETALQDCEYLAAWTPVMILCSLCLLLLCCCAPVLLLCAVSPMGAGTSGAGFLSWTSCKGDGTEQQQQQQQAGEEERQNCHRASCRLWTCTGYGCATDSRLHPGVLTSHPRALQPQCIQLLLSLSPTFFLPFSNSYPTTLPSSPPPHTPSLPIAAHSSSSPQDAYARDCLEMFSKVLDCPLPLLDPAASSSSSSFSTSFSSSSFSSSAHSPHSPSLLSPPTPSMHSHSFRQYADQQQQQQAEAVAVSRRVWNERWPGDPYDLHFFQRAVNTAASAAASLAALHLPPSLLGASSSLRSTPSSLSVESPRAPPAVAAAAAAAATGGALGSRAEQEGGECADGEEAAASVQERISYDLEAAVARQARFFHQIARPHMHDAKYLVGAVERYKAFLWLLKHQLPAANSTAAGAAAAAAGDGSGRAGSMFIPALDIDFVWHAHQVKPASSTPLSRFHAPCKPHFLSNPSSPPHSSRFCNLFKPLCRCLICPPRVQLAPLAYAHDCNALLGRLLAHHDSLPDHHAPPPSSHTPLSSADQQQQQSPSLASATQSTAATWLRFYGRPYARAGTIRKEPPPAPFPFPPPIKPKHGVGAGAVGGGGSGAGSTASGASSMGTGSHLPSGSSSRGTSKIASPVSSPGASPIQDTRGELRAGIPPRHVFDVTLSLLSVSSLPASLKGDLSLQISALSACPSLRLRSHKLPLPLPLPLPSPSSSPSQSLPANEHPWPRTPTWWLSLDVETKGVVLQLLLEPPKGRLSGIAGMAGMGGTHKARSLGEVTVLWSDVFGAKDLSWHAALALGSGAGAGGKSVHCAVLCCAVLCCAVRCCAVRCCAVLCCAVLCGAVLCCAVLCCAVHPGQQLPSHVLTLCPSLPVMGAHALIPSAADRVPPTIPMCAFTSPPHHLRYSPSPSCPALPCPALPCPPLLTAFPSFSHPFFPSSASLSPSSFFLRSPSSDGWAPEDGEPSSSYSPFSVLPAADAAASSGHGRQWAAANSSSSSGAEAAAGGAVDGAHRGGPHSLRALRSAHPQQQQPAGAKGYPGQVRSCQPLSSSFCPHHSFCPSPLPPASLTPLPRFFLPPTHLPPSMPVRGCRVAKGHGSQQVEVPPESKRVLLHRGGWSPSPKVKGALVASGERVDEVCQLRTHHTMATQRTWMAYSGWTLQVSLRQSHLPSASSLPSSASLSASASSSSASSSAASAPAFPGLRYHVAKVPGPPMALAPGRRLAYSRPLSSFSPPISSSSALLRSSSTVGAAAAHAGRVERGGGAGAGAVGGEGEGEDREGEEAGYVTVVRYPEDCPGGVATALFNWRTGGIEVQPHERLDVVALMAVAVAQSWHDLHLAATTAGSASAASAAKKKSAGSTSAKPAPVKITPSKLPRRAASVGKDDRWGTWEDVILERLCA